MTRVDHRGVIAVPSPPVLVGAPRLTSTPTAFPTIDGATPDSVLDGGSTGRLVVRAASVRGDDHRFYGETRQDAFGIRAIRTPAGDEILIVCVADGVGSEPMSHVGARKVCGRLAAGLAPVAESLLTGPPDQRFGHMVATAIRELAGILTAEARSRSIEPERLSTTVTCALIAMSADGVGRVAWFRVGDSEAFTLRGLAFNPMFDGRPGAFAETRTAALPSHPESIEIVHSDALPGDVVILCTDGLPVGSPPIAHQLSSWWNRDVPNLAEFYWQLSFRCPVLRRRPDRGLCVGDVSMADTDVQVRDLRLTHVLGVGGEGEVFGIDGRPGRVFKRYLTADIDDAALQAIIDFPATISLDERRLLLDRTTWPTGRVVDGRRVVGFTMPVIPELFLARVDGGRRPRELQYLMFPPKPFWGDVRPLTGVERVEFLRQVMSVMRLLHRYGAVIGDVSQANVLWSEGPSPRALLIDCDSIRLSDHRNVCRPKETPDWIDPTLGPASPDLASDRYKVAALIMRVLARNAHSEPPDPSLSVLPDVPTKVAAAVGALYAASGGVRSERPTVEGWDRALRGLSSTYTTPSVVRLPTPRLDLTSIPARPTITLSRPLSPGNPSMPG